MTRPAIPQVARLLRADVPPVADEQFVQTLAEVARSSSAAPARRVTLGVKVAAVAAAVAVVMFGAAYASDRFATPSPTHLDPTQPVTDEPTEDVRGDRGPERPEDAAAHRRRPEVGTAPGGSPRTSSVGSADATAPAAAEDDPPAASTDAPPPGDEPGPGDDGPGVQDDHEDDDDDSAGSQDEEEDDAEGDTPGDAPDDAEDDTASDTDDDTEDDAEDDSQDSPDDEVVDGPDPDDD